MRDVRVFATSRLALGTAGEFDYALAPLEIPSDGATPEEIRRSASVRLFLERGRAVRRDLTADGGQLLTVGRICRELDGLPLAIELASARAKVLSIDEIAALLADRFRFLRSWSRLADARHRTLRATMDWSLELLSHEERDLLSRLSVFAGGFDLDAVAAVCVAGDDVHALDLLSRLVDASLVVVEVTPNGSRYRLLETIRAYAAGLTRVLTPEEIERLNNLGDRLRDRLNSFASERDIDFCPTGRGSLVGLHFARGPIRREADVPEAAELRGLLHLHMLERGWCYGRRGFIALSLRSARPRSTGSLQPSRNFSPSCEPPLKRSFGEVPARRVRLAALTDAGRLRCRPRTPLPGGELPHLERSPPRRLVPRFAERRERDRVPGRRTPSTTRAC